MYTVHANYLQKNGWEQWSFYRNSSRSSIMKQAGLAAHCPRVKWDRGGRRRKTRSMQRPLSPIGTIYLQSKCPDPANVTLSLRNVYFLMLLLDNDLLWLHDYRSGGVGSRPFDCISKVAYHWLLTDTLGIIFNSTWRVWGSVWITCTTCMSV